MTNFQTEPENATLADAIRFLMEMFVASSFPPLDDADADIGVPSEAEMTEGDELPDGLDNVWDESAASMDYAEAAFGDTDMALDGADVGLSDADVGLSDADVGLSDADVGLGGVNVASLAPHKLLGALAGLLGNAAVDPQLMQEAFSSVMSQLNNKEIAATASSGRAAIENAVRDGRLNMTVALQAIASMQQHAQQQQEEQQQPPPPPQLPNTTLVDTMLSPSASGSVVSFLRNVPATQWVLWVATLVLGYLAVRLLFGRLLYLSGVVGGGRRPRTTTVLLGLPDSGKTALYAQLVHQKVLLESRTSMRANSGLMHAAARHGRSSTAVGVKVVDCPGHPRLREAMLRAVAEAANVVVVIDSVSVQDGQQDGVAALAELLLGVLQSPEFYGVRRLVFACTKRDEVVSYASKAVRKLLEAAMVASIESRQNALGRVESVRDANNAVIARRGTRGGGGGGSGGGRRYLLSVDGADAAAEDAAPVHARLRGAGGGKAKSFSFDQLGIPVVFVDVSSRPNTAEHRYSVAALEAAVLGDVVSG
ncbi:Elongation factor Tu GTP binding domain containing protein [Novymonas esmeraldas]|uniref:Signal recognition particle receptor subunit beta n=1 Tax=Novymonas esmeraldas TaxID=1808958 RepID=A0AAW0ES22_9TRYP